MKLTTDQIAYILRDCDARARSGSLEPRLQHARKQMYQRRGKPLAKHGTETLKKASGT